MQTEEVTVKDVAIIEQKREAWGEMGVIVYKSEMELQARGQGIIKSLTIPQKIEDLPEAEKKLKAATSERVKLENDRKEITGKFDDVAARLMKPEKDVAESIANFKSKMVSLKAEHERIQAAKAAKENEIRTVRERVQQYMAEKDFQYKSLIAGKCAEAFEYALTKDIAPDAIAAYIEKIKGRLGAADFQTEAPTFRVAYLDLNEVQLLIEENFRVNPHAYVTIFQAELDKKFSDYDVAYANKKDALALAIKEQAEKEAALKAEKENADLAAKIASTSEPLLFTGDNVVAPVKALKKSFEIDMDETQHNAIKIMQAYVANMALCDQFLKINKWFGITPNQMATALGKVKSQDNAFQPVGINFKEVSKL
jgi:hypothetical protein